MKAKPCLGGLTDMFAVYNGAFFFLLSVLRLHFHFLVCVPHAKWWAKCVKSDIAKG